MRGVLKSELIKLKKRNDFLMFLTMIFLPVLYSVGAAANSNAIVYTAAEKSTFFGFYSQMMMFAYMIFIYLVLLGMCAVRSLRGEIDNRSIRLHLQRIGNRNRLYFSKHVAVIVSTLGICAIFFLACLACYYTLVTQRTDIALKQFLRLDEFGAQAAAVGSIILYFMVIVFAGFAVSSFLNSGASIGVVLLFMVLFSYIKEFSAVKYLSPAYYIQELMSTERSIDTGFGMIGMLGVSVSLCAIAYLIGKRRFSRIDV